MSNLQEKVIFTGKDVHALLPQSDPIQMVDTLWSSDEKKTVSGFTIDKDNMFVQDGEFVEPGILENIAQTAGLGLGYKNLLGNNLEGQAPSIGFIGAVKKLRIYKLPLVNDVLRTTVVIGSKVFNVTSISGETYLGTELIAECEMKIVEKKS
jgi:hypothetical protein